MAFVIVNYIKFFKNLINPKPIIGQIFFNHEKENILCFTQHINKYFVWIKFPQSMENGSYFIH